MFNDGEKTMQYTYAFTTNGLRLPAFIRSDNRTWRIKTPHDEAIFRCEFDPFAVPVGKAEFPTTAPPDHPRYYIYEQGPNLRAGNDRNRQLRFLV